MDLDRYLNLIPQSQSDHLLNDWGYNLIREYFSIVGQLSQTNTTAVELATGTGRMCAVLSCLFPSIVSCDISLQDLPRAKQRLPQQYADRISFIQTDMEHLPFRSDSIRTLVCMNTLHEVSNPIRCLTEMVRVIHPNGSLVVGDFSQTGFDAMQKIHSIVYHNDHHAGSITLNEIEQCIAPSFRELRSFSSPLNVTLFASGKRL